MSLSRMLQDIAIFLVIFLIMLFSFASGLYYLYHKYDGEVRYEHGQKVAEQVKAFNTLVLAFLPTSLRVCVLHSVLFLTGSS